MSNLQTWAVILGLFILALGWLVFVAVFRWLAWRERTAQRRTLKNVDELAEVHNLFSSTDAGDALRERVLEKKDVDGIKTQHGRRGEF